MFGELNIWWAGFVANCLKRQWSEIVIPNSYSGKVQQTIPISFP
jgi:hypothetical protein